jgi:hypothetical protein
MDTWVIHPSLHLITDVHITLDNAGTWDKLAPMIVSSKRLDVTVPFYNLCSHLHSSGEVSEQHSTNRIEREMYRLVAMDFVGHGHSSHASPSGNYTL